MGVTYYTVYIPAEENAHTIHGMCVDRSVANLENNSGMHTKKERLRASILAR